MESLPEVAAIVGCAWICLIATALIVFRVRSVTLLERAVPPDDRTEAQRREASIGVVLVAVFAYVLAATVAAMSLLPAGDKAWPLAIGLPVAALVSVLYWLRLANAGLSLTAWPRR